MQNPGVRSQESEYIHPMAMGIASRSMAPGPLSSLSVPIAHLAGTSTIPDSGTCSIRAYRVPGRSLLLYSDSVYGA